MGPGKKSLIDMNDFRDSDFRTSDVEIGTNNTPELCGGGVCCYQRSQGRYRRGRGNHSAFH